MLMCKRYWLSPDLTTEGPCFMGQFPRPTTVMWEVYTYFWKSNSSLGNVILLKFLELLLVVMCTVWFQGKYGCSAVKLREYSENTHIKLNDSKSRT